MDLTLGEIVAATAGQLEGGTPDTVIRTFAFDSRSLAGGSCFVALQGERDGHDFVDDAFRRGAGAAIVSRRSGIRVEGPLVLVVDPLRALADLGRLARARLRDAHLVAVTGSAGKTATKDLTAAACGRQLEVHASPGSYNNEFGLPLTLLAAGARVDVIVAEMGARFPGNIAELCDIARPDIGVVTHIGLAHAEHLGGPDGIAQVKAELPAALPESGIAVLNADDAATSELVAATRARVVQVGSRAAGVDVRVSGVRLDEQLRPRFRLESPWGSVDLRLAVRGHHQAMNAAMAAAVALSLGVPLDDVRLGLVEATTASWRMQLHHSADGISVLNDAYNASPTSVAAALASFAHLPVTGRRVAVLGEMLELGEHGEVEHARMGERAADAGVAMLVVVGEGARPAAARARDRGLEVFEVADGPHALATAREVLRPGDAVLVKASRAVGLEAVVDGLLGEEVRSR